MNKILKRMRLRNTRKSALLQIEGRSLPVNVGLIVLNILGLVFLAKGYHPSGEEINWLIPTGYGIFLLSFVGMVFFRGLYLMSYVSRAFVGGLFIVSGLVKANDPKGFAYKLEEYFEDGALAYRVRDLLGWENFSLEGFIESALLLSVVICIIEIVLGVMVIIGARIKLASWLLLGMMLFFTALTWHTKECVPTDTFTKKMEFAANSPQALDYIAKADSRDDLKILSQDGNKVIVAEQRQVQCVNDCGCFGDALKGSVGRSLTPQESFWKDIVVGYFVLIIFLMQFTVMRNTGRDNTVLGIGSLIVVVFFSWVFGWYFPLGFGIVTILAALWIRRSGGRFLGNDWGAILLSTLLTALVVSYVLLYEPLKDYRPYAVGSDLNEKMNDGVDGKVENTFVYKNSVTGETRTMDNDTYMNSKIWEDTTWVFESMMDKVIVEPKLPSITEQFNPSIEASVLTPREREMPLFKQMLASALVDGIVMSSKAYGISDTMSKEDFYPEDYDSTYVKQEIKILSPDAGELSALQLILTAPSIFVLSVEDVTSANWNRLNELKEIAAKAEEMNIPFILICGSARTDIDAFRAKYNFWVPTFSNDRTELKAVTRSNPGLLLIQKGVVKAKYPHRGLPSFETIRKNFLAS
jgi:uncharacterized membrane protein YphA (DoxX/SURF4 family)